MESSLILLLIPALIGAWVGSFLFGFLLLRWLVHARAERFCKDDCTAGTLSSILLLFGLVYFGSSEDSSPLTIQVLLAAPFGTLFFLAGLGTVRFARRRLHRSRAVSFDVLAKRRRLCALGVALTALLTFGAERLLMPLPN